MPGVDALAIVITDGPRVLAYLTAKAARTFADELAHLANYLDERDDDDADQPAGWPATGGN